MSTITNLSQILGQKDFNALTADEKSAYLADFAAFKLQHAKQYPEGQSIVLPIAKVTMLPDQDGNYRFELKATPNTYSPVFKFKPATAAIMLGNALQLPIGVCIPLLIRSLAKGSLKTTVQVVDETDFYTDKDGVEQNYSGPSVARFGNTQIEYVPSTEVLQNAQSAYLRIEEMQLAAMLNGMTAKSATNDTSTPTVPAHADEEEI